MATPSFSERCSCGASIALDFTPQTALDGREARFDFIREWRREHHHPAAEAQPESDKPPYIAQVSGASVERAPVGFMPHDYEPTVG